MGKKYGRIIALVLIAFFFMYFFMRDKSLAATTREYNELIDEPLKRPPKEAQEIEPISRPEFEYNAESFNDPFADYLPKHVVAAAEKTGISEETLERLRNLQVQGIIWGSDLPQAIISNRVVKVGDTLEGGRVSAISKEGVTVVIEDREFKLGSPSNAATVPDKP